VLKLALSQLGLLVEQLEQTPFEAYVEPTLDVEAIELRYEHADLQNLSPELLFEN